MERSAKESCHDCLFQYNHQCRRHAPARRSCCDSAATHPRIISVYRDWCGDWQPKEETPEGHSET